MPDQYASREWPKACQYYHRLDVANTLMDKRRGLNTFDAILNSITIIGNKPEYQRVRES